MSSAYPEHAIQCPHCGASVDNRCTTRSGRRKLAIPSHDARITAWTAQADADRTPTQ